MRLEVITEVEDVMLDPQAFGHVAGVVHIGHRAASRIRLTTPQLERHTDHLVAGLDEPSGRDRRVDTARHRDHDPLPAHAGAPSRACDCRRLAAAGTPTATARTSAWWWTSPSRGAAIRAPAWPRSRARRARATAAGHRWRSSTPRRPAPGGRARGRRAGPRWPRREAHVHDPRDQVRSIAAGRGALDGAGDAGDDGVDEGCSRRAVAAIDGRVRSAAASSAAVANATAPPRPGCHFAARAPGRHRAAGPRGWRRRGPRALRCRRGPPHLCDASVMRSTSGRVLAEIEPAQRLRGVDVQQRVRGAQRRTSLHDAPSGWTVPTSLFTSTTETTDTVGSSRRSELPRGRGGRTDRRRWWTRPTVRRDGSRRGDPMPRRARCLPPARRGRPAQRGCRPRSHRR